MLVPVRITAHYKVTASETVTLEDLAGANLPLLFGELRVYNRTPTADSVTISCMSSTTLTGQTDPDFNGVLEASPFPSASLSNGQTQAYDIGTLLAAGSGTVTELEIANAGPAPEARVTVVLSGLIESSVSPDVQTVVNV